MNSLATVIVKGGESECFRMDSGVVADPFGSSMYIWMRVIFLVEGKEGRFSGLLYAGDLVFMVNRNRAWR